MYVSLWIKYLVKIIQELNDSLNAEKLKIANLEIELAAIKSHLGI